MFLLWETAALSKYEYKQKLYLLGPEGKRELPPSPEVRESWRLRVHYRKACYDLHRSSNSITTHTLDARKGTGDDTHQHPELVLIKPPSRKPLKTWSDSVSLLPHPRPITLLILWGLTLLLCKKKQNKNNLPPAEAAVKCAGSDCSLHAAAKSAVPNFCQSGGRWMRGDCGCCEHRVNMEDESMRWRDCLWVRQVSWIHSYALHKHAREAKRLNTVWVKVRSTLYCWRWKFSKF